MEEPEQHDSAFTHTHKKNTCLLFLLVFLLYVSNAASVVSRVAASAVLIHAAEMLLKVSLMCVCVTEETTRLRFSGKQHVRAKNC